MKRMVISCVIMALILSFFPAAAGFSDTSFENRSAENAAEQTETRDDEQVQAKQTETQEPYTETQAAQSELFEDMPYIPGSLMQISASGEKCTAVRNALDNRLYNHTLEQLVNSEGAQGGTRNDVVESIQETLRNFGVDVEVDGLYSDRLMNAFNGVLSSFRLDKVKKLDADSYARLLGIMLIKEDPDKALEIIFPGRDPQKDKGLAGYLQGCVNMAQEKYYSAKSDFKASRYDDYKTRLKECEIPEPANGVIWENPDLFDPYTSLELILTNDDQNRDVYLEIYTSEGVLQSQLYLTGSGSVRTNLAAGTYVIKIAYGTLWYGVKEAFGKSGNYSYIYFEEGDAFGDGYEITFDAGFEYQVNVYVTDSYLGGPSATWEDWMDGLPDEFPAVD